MATWNGTTSYIPKNSELGRSITFPPASAASYANALLSPASCSPDSSATITNVRTITEELALAMNLTKFCVNCDANNEINYECNTCKMLFCYFCANAHKHFLATKDHKLTRHPHVRYKTSSISDSSSPNSSRTASTPSPSSICDIHLEPITFFCETCLMAICTDCSIRHTQHRTSQYHQLLETATHNNQRLCKETLNIHSSIQRSMQQIHCIADSIDHQMYQAQTDVEQFTRYLQLALEKKRSEVVNKINNTRRQKVDRLSYQMQTLEEMKMQAEFASRRLEDTQQCTNPAEILLANEEVSQTLSMLKSFKNRLFPCENENVNFVYDKSQFRQLLGLPETGPSTASSTSSGATTTTVMPHPSYVARVQQQIPRVSVYEKIPTAATDLFVFEQSMPSSRAVYGVVSTIAVDDDFQKVPSFFGSEGSGESQFCRPWGVCCNNLGQLIVVDRSNNRIQVFSSSGEFLYQFGRHGKGAGEFDRPAGATVSPEGNIVVADKDNHRVQVFQMDGTFLFNFGQRGSEDGDFNYPWDVACNVLGHIAVSDTRNHRVQLFTSNGVFLNKFGFEQGMWKYLDSPRGICFTPNGHIAVTDFNNHRVLVIDRTMTKSQHFGHFGHDLKDLLRPQGIVCDDQGKFLVADSRNHRIQIYDAEGRLLGMLGGVHSSDGMDRPSGICLTPEGNVVTVDFGNSRVAIF